MYFCRRIRLCSYLLDRGFNFIKTEPDVNNPKYKIWLFKKTPELLEVVEEYYATVPVK